MCVFGEVGVNVIDVGQEQEGAKDCSLGDARRTGGGEDVVPSTKTVWVRSDRKERIHRWRGSPMPSAVSFRRSFSWSTLSKAFEISRRMASICCLLLRQ